MEMQRIVTKWSQADAGQQYQWAQQLRFNTTLNEDDVQALVSLYREVLKSDSIVQRVMEESILTVMLRLCNPECISVLEEVLFADPPRGNSPLAEIVLTLGGITRCTDSEHGYHVLERCLEHPDVDVRDMATTAIVRAYKQNNRPLPARVVDKLYILLQGDYSRRVRFSAGLALQELGEIDMLDAIFWSEDLAGWEEDVHWDIFDHTGETGAFDEGEDINDVGLHKG